MVKIDLQKSYDSVEWPYLNQVISELGFPDKFVSWIIECLRAVNFTVMVNWETINPFDAAKVLRQGDLISPYLFSVAMEYLSRKLHELRDDKSFNFHPICAKLKITHMSFVDDLLLFSIGDMKSVNALHQAFKQFSEASGYLGVPLSTKNISFIQWLPLIEKIVDRITSWTTKKLSYAGRVQLVQSVLFGVQSYWSQLFQMPVKVLKLIDAYCRSFVWSGTETITKKALVSWEKMYLPRTFGGLNLLNIKIWNRVSLAKTHWYLAHKDDKLWIKWIHEFYLKGHPLTTTRVPQQACWIMRKILEARQTLLQVQIRKGPGSLTKHIYEQLLPSYPKVPWKCMMYDNDARPKAKFIMWLQLQDKFLTTDRLANWG
uniref:Reverse transcriptase domain-containing protein n=1 Tax=Nicotiana tabacum TaxID=4097 RepID=A0A1S4DPA3_TOBAC|nr:PREDICTED: uncharacterized protein LOC107831694 [Nicotiana tabacum]